MDWALLIAAVHAGATWWMVGLVWFVQRVHYPMIAGLARTAEAAAGDGEAFCAAEREHMRRTGPVTGPIMLVELACAVGLLVWAPEGAGLVWWVGAWAGLGLLAVVWGSTVFEQIPLHGRLCDAADTAAAARLVRTNWVRTAAWTLRGVLALGLLVWRW